MELGIEKIVLEFENCEILEVPAWWIANFFVGDFKTQIARIATNAIHKYTIADKVLIEIAKGFDGEFSGWGGNPISKFERISKFNDITHVEIFYEREYVTDPENSETFAVNYKEEREGALGSPNLLQKCSFDHSGNLLITISSDPEYLLNHDEFINATDTDFSYDMFDIGIPWEPCHKLIKDDGSFDLPDEGEIVYVDNGKDRLDYKGAYAYRSNGSWIIKPSKYEIDGQEERQQITSEEIYKWARHRTCSEKYQKED